MANLAHLLFVCRSWPVRQRGKVPVVASAMGAKAKKQKSAKVTPMMRQFLDAKNAYPDALLLFRMGDFYEMFFDDARTASQVLDLTLTSRDKDKGEGAVPMAGFPHHALTNYLPRLIADGIKVAICDQVEDPKQAKGLVKREVTRLVTAGTTLDEVSLDARRNNYVAALTQGQQEETLTVFALAALDVSTGEALVTELNDPLEVIDTVDRLGIAELLLVGEIDKALVKRIEALDQRRRIDRVGDDLADDVDAHFFSSRWPSDRPVDGVAAQATAAAMAYVLQVQRGHADQLGSVTWVQGDAQLILDSATRRHLDILSNSVDGKRRGSLLGAVDNSVTAMGGRRIARWLSAPSRQRDVIEQRLAGVEDLVDSPVVRDQFREALSGMPDLERLSARCVAGHASPRDLGAIRTALAQIPLLSVTAQSLKALQPWLSALDPVDEVQDLLAAALVDEPPAILRDGRFVRQGYDAEIDRLRHIAGGAKETLAAIELRERERTAIGSLKVRYNKVFGYFIEVTKTHLDKVPEDYIRKQTIAGGERYITQELKTLEDEILHADERRLAREQEIFRVLVDAVSAQAQRLRLSSAAVGELDAMTGFAATAARWNYCRPEFHDDADAALRIDEGRHPVVEQLSRELGEAFVPNDLRMDCDERQVLIMTGPNMAGKSTIMRQVALIQVLAQAGSFVPASAARLPLCDRIFTRVGASDDVSRGRSTFMVEMTETARILAGATPQSLILLDEIGRGTSTFDGLAIAWAVTEHLHAAVGAKAIFATHYHELTALAGLLSRVHNVHVAVKEWNEDVHFIRRLLDGSAERSYGIQVARLAGLPVDVLDRAKEVLAGLESDQERPRVPQRLGLAGATRKKKSTNQLNLFAKPASADELVTTKLRALQIDQTTPLQALTLLAEYREILLQHDAQAAS